MFIGIFIALMLAVVVLALGGKLCWIVGHDWRQRTNFLGEVDRIECFCCGKIKE